MKYLGQVEYSFDKKGYLPREFPKHSVAVSYQYDNMLPSDKFINTDKDNMFTSLKWAKQTLYNYERKFTINAFRPKSTYLKPLILASFCTKPPMLLSDFVSSVAR